MLVRNEFKFPFTFWDDPQVKDFILDQRMKIAYPMREVNSFYFDNESLEYHMLGEEGIVPRKKIRLRIYGNAVNSIYKSMLEIKSAFSDRREKLSNLFYEINENDGSKLGNIKKKILQKYLMPTVYIYYKRIYLENDVKLRMTLDYGLIYKRFSLTEKMQPIFLNYKREKFNVLELKGPIIRTENIIIRSKINWMRFSKYSRGMDSFEF